MNTSVISLKYQYFSQLRKTVREEVLKLMEGADIDSVSSDAVLAYHIINHFEQEAAVAAASAPAAAASNVAVSNTVANNQCEAANEAAKVDEVAANEATAQDSGSRALPRRSAAADPEASLEATATEPHRGDRFAAPNQAAEAPVSAPAAPAVPVEAVRCEERPQVWLDMERLPVEEFCRGSTLKGVGAERACDYVCTFAQNFVTLQYENERN